MMGTADVRLDTKLNKYVWHRGIRNIPRRVRVRLSRRRNEDDEAKEQVRRELPAPRSTHGTDARASSGPQLYTLVEVVEVPSFKSLQTEVVSE